MQVSKDGCIVADICDDNNEFVPKSHSPEQLYVSMRSMNEE